MLRFWKALSRGARIGLVTGVAAIAVLVALSGAWLLRADYQVLFSGLAPQDANAMVSELDRMKVPYRLGDDGTSILVERDAVHRTRIKLMGKDLPLHGAVGFELFNNSDFGMTEFAQKINYQRALQGEISRTILSLEEVEAVRVHLAMPEEGLFKRAGNKGKAAITLTMKRGQALRPAQVAGIQRLVAAAVPNVAAQDVTIVDQHGVALTRPAQGDAEGETGAQRLDLKRETEAYLGRKADDVLERRFGAGQAMASVDVTLDMDQVRITTEDVVAPGVRSNQAPAGIVVRERETIRDPGAPAAGKGAEGAGSSQREVEYQVGRRVEQIVGSPGSIRRIHVAAVVRAPLDAGEIEQARALVFAAVGASQERGDVVVVQALAAAGTTPAIDASPQAPLAAAARTPPPVEDTSIIAALGLAAVIAFALVLAFIAARRRRRVPAAALSHVERQALLTQVRSWVAQDASIATAPKRAQP